MFKKSVLHFLLILNLITIVYVILFLIFVRPMEQEKEVEHCHRCGKRGLDYIDLPQFAYDNGFTYCYRCYRDCILGMDATETTKFKKHLNTIGYQAVYPNVVLIKKKEEKK